MGKTGHCYRVSRRRQWHPTLVLLPGKSHGRRSLEGCSPWGHWGSDTTERLHFHFSLWCIGEGNSNPLQCSCLENPRDGVAWWAAVYGVAQSRRQLSDLAAASTVSSTPTQTCMVYSYHEVVKYTHTQRHTPANTWMGRQEWFSDFFFFSTVIL